MQRIITGTTNLSGERMINFRDVDVHNKFIFIKHSGCFGRLERYSDNRYYMYCLSEVEIYPTLWCNDFGGAYQNPLTLIEKVINSGADIYQFDTFQEAVDWMYRETR
jgi:hypothetical protein